MKRFVLVLLFWGLLPFGAIGQNAPIAEVTQAPESYYTIEQEPKVQLEKEKGKSDLANDYIGEQEKENSFITKVVLLLFSMISFITYLLGYRPLKKIVDDPNLSVYQKYAQLKENNSMWGCVGCLFSILFPPFICRKCGNIHQESIKKAVRSSSPKDNKSSRKDDSYGSSSSYNRSSSSYNKSYRSGGGASTKF